MAFKSNNNKQPAEKSAAPLAPSDVPVLEEIRDLLKQQAEDMRWLRDKLERANTLGR